MKMRIPAILLAGAAGLALAACGSQEEPAPESDPDMMPGVSVENARLLLPAVSGNPAAVYFDLKYDGDRAAVVRKAEVAGAEDTMMHEMRDNNGVMEMQDLTQVPLQKGETVTFEPGGKHVMASGLGEDVAPGTTVEVTLTFVGGDKASFPAEVRAAGDER